MQRPWTDEERLRELYCEEDLSIHDTAHELDCGHMTVSRWLDKHGIEKEQDPADKPVLYRTDEAGYERWRHNTNDTKYAVSVHRLACVAWFGFDAVKGKDVHHENRISWDNRQANLALLTPEEHQDEHTESISNEKLRDYIYRRSLSPDDISDEEGVSVNVVRRELRESPVVYPIKPYQRPHVLETLVSLESVNEIAERFDVDVDTIHKYLRKYDIDTLPPWKLNYDEDELREMYFEQDMTMKEIGEELGVTQGRVSQLFSKFDIDVGVQNTNRDEYPWRDEDRLRELYHGEMLGMAKVADRLDTTVETVNRWLQKFDIEKHDPVAFNQT